MLSKPGAETGAKGIHPVERNVVEDTFGHGEQQRYLFAQGEGRELRLAQYRTNAPSMLYDPARALVDHGSEAGKDFEFEKLRVLETQTFR